MASAMLLLAFCGDILQEEEEEEEEVVVVVAEAAVGVFCPGLRRLEAVLPGEVQKRVKTHLPLFRRPTVRV
jgi:hypothetical protein